MFDNANVYHDYWDSTDTTELRLRPSCVSVQLGTEPKV